MAKKVNYADMFTLRSDGRYQGYWRDADGKRHAVCDRDPEKLFGKIQQLESPPPLTFRKITEAWKEYIWPQVRAGTQVCYNPAINRALDMFGDRAAAGIEPYEIKNHLERLNEQHYSAQTIKVQLMIYNQVYRHAIVDPDMGREIRTNPASDVSLPSKMKKPSKRQAPEDDIVKLIRKSADDYFGLFPLFCMSTGMRRGEALAIQWKDIDFKGGNIHISKQVNYESGMAEITEPKTDAGIRTVPLLPDLKAVLQMPENAQPTHYLFHGDDPAKPMPDKNYRRRWLQYCKNHGFAEDVPTITTGKNGRKYLKHHWKPTLTAHVLRHGYATLLFEADVDEYTAQKLIGHSDISTTHAIYTHLREQKKNESIDKLRDHVSAELISPQLDSQKS